MPMLSAAGLISQVRKSPYDVEREPVRTVLLGLNVIADPKHGPLRPYAAVCSPSTPLPVSK